MAADPLPLEVAYDKEQQFLADVRAVIRDEVQRQTKLAVEQMAQTNKALPKLIDAVSGLARRFGVVEQAVDRLVSWTTRKGLQDDRIEQKLDAFFETVTPPKPTPPS